MIELKAIQKKMLSMLEEYAGCKAIPSNTTKNIPAYPYISFSVINIDTRKGTYSAYTGTKEVEGRETPIKFLVMPMSLKYSLTVQSDNEAEALEIAMKVKDFFEEDKRQELADNEIIVADVGGITPRDTMLTIEYEYRKGLDVTLRLNNVIVKEKEESFENVTINDIEF